MANINSEMNAAIHRRLSLSNQTIRNLSDNTGIPYTTLRRKLTGGSFTIEEISAIADALRVSPVDLFASVMEVAA